MSVEIVNHCTIARENAGLRSWSLAWRLECEARALLALPLVLRRQELAKPARVGRRQELEAEMVRLFNERRGSS